MGSYHVFAVAVLMGLNAVPATAQTNNQQYDILGPAVEREKPDQQFQLDLTAAPPQEVEATPDEAEPAKPRGEFADRLWNYLQSGPVAYNEWRAFPGQPEGLQPGRSPHGSQVRLVANRKARASAAALEPGSILLKENYNAAGNRLLSITLMYRSAGYDPAHNDWFWANFRPDGSLAKINGRPAAGRISTCIDCHASAGDGDYVFAND